MSGFNGSGTFNISGVGLPYVSGTTISSSVANQLNIDLANGLTNCITKDGQQSIQANIPFNNYKITQLGAATAATDAASVLNIQNATGTFLSVTGTNTIVATATPAITGYVAGMTFRFVAAGTNVGPVTINISGLGAKAITKEDSQPLEDGDINSGYLVSVTYDGTNFVLQSGIGGGSGLIEQETQTATSGQTVFTLTGITYTPGANNLCVFVDGVKQYVGSSYTETNITTVTFSSGLHTGASVQFIVFSTVEIGTMSAASVTYTPSGTGAVTTNVQTKLRETVSVKDFGAVGDGVVDDTNAILNAIAATPVGGVLFLRGISGDIFRTTGIVVVRSNITIIGNRKPKANGNNHSLEGGTIIKGTFLIDGDNITLEKFGVDHGITYSNTYKSGLGGDGLVVHNIGLTTIRRNINVKDVIGLTRIGNYLDTQAAFHAVLLEGLENGCSNNVTGVGGWYGIVLKTSNWTFDGLTAIENDTAGVYIKSNIYGPVSNVVGTNVVGIAGSSRMYCGFLVQASNAELANVSVSNVTIIGGGVGAAVRIEGEVSQPVVDVEISGVTTRNTISGASFRGPIYASKISGVIDKPSGGTGLEVAVNTVAAQPNDVTANLRINVDSAVSSSNHVNISAGSTKVNLECAYVTVGYNTPGNLLVTANTQIGEIYGVLSCDRTEANLLNSWAVFSTGQKCGTITRNGYTQGYGRIKFNSATSDTFLTLPAGAYPTLVQQIVAVTGFDGTTNKPAPVYIQIDGSGNCSIYPNRATYTGTISYVDLSSLKIQAQLPVASGSI